MKRIAIVLCSLSILILSVFMVCQHAPSLLQAILIRYEKLLDNPLPEEFCLEIYYIDPYLLTRAPVNVEELKAFDDVTKIYVAHDTLADHIPLLKKLNHSMIQPKKEEGYINARLYYAFSVGDSTILEVVINPMHGPIFVNGIAVENHPVFYELIVPFLSDEDRSILGF